MVIDAHVYSLPSRLRQIDCSFPAEEHGAPRAIHRSSPVSVAEQALRLSSAEEILASMDVAAIDVSVLTALPWNSPSLCFENNDYILDRAAYDRSHFLPVCAVQPKNSCWLHDAQECVDRGAIGLKINPEWQGFSLEDPDVIRLGSFCAEAKIFLEIHIDHAFKKSLTSAAALCSLLKSCPTTKILATHLGGLLGLYFIHPPIGALLRNVWFDTAVSSTLQFVDFYLQVGLGQKVVFGSDFPFNHSHSQQQVLEGLRTRGYDDETLVGLCTTNFLELCEAGRPS